MAGVLVVVFLVLLDSLFERDDDWVSFLFLFFFHEQMGAPALYPGGFGVVLMMLLMTLVTPVEAVAGTVVAILLGSIIRISQYRSL